MRLFHYHLVTNALRDVEARYLGRLGFGLVARYGRVGEEDVAIEPGTPWETLDDQGFKARLTEVQRGGVNVVVQPGHWRNPRVDHLGIALDEEAFHGVLLRAASWSLPVHERGGGRTFVSTNAGYRLEIHPPHDWADELLDAGDRFALEALELRADNPDHKALVLADLLGLDARAGTVEVGDTVVRFLGNGPEGRPELYAERFG